MLSLRNYIHYYKLGNHLLHILRCYDKKIDHKHVFNYKVCIF